MAEAEVLCDCWDKTMVMVVPSWRDFRQPLIQVTISFNKKQISMLVLVLVYTYMKIGGYSLVFIFAFFDNLMYSIKVYCRDKGMFASPCGCARYLA